jgi:hypothetical protein
MRVGGIGPEGSFDLIFLAFDWCLQAPSDSVYILLLLTDMLMLCSFIT